LLLTSTKKKKKKKKSAHSHKQRRRKRNRISVRRTILLWSFSSVITQILVRSIPLNGKRVDSNSAVLILILAWTLGLRLICRTRTQRCVHSHALIELPSRSTHVDKYLLKISHHSTLYKETVYSQRHLVSIINIYYLNDLTYTRVCVCITCEISQILYIAPLEEQCHNSKNAHFELCPQEVCLKPYLPSGIASHVYFLKWPREGRSVVLLMRLHRPGQWFFLSPEKFYFSSGDSILPGVRYIHIHTCLHIFYVECYNCVFKWLWMVSTTDTYSMY
jgi:hypothetical protein